MATVANVRVVFLGLASVAVLAFAPRVKGPALLQETHEVTIREGTNMAAVLSPDGSTLALDALGRIWVLPVEGGSARPLTDPLGEPPGASARGQTHDPERSRPGREQMFQHLQRALTDRARRADDGDCGHDVRYLVLAGACSVELGDQKISATRAR